ncbi:MAG: hypothetical protein K9M45_09305 [Kiritimatiellales bacterium]|nr:hypothetical protein [Kiritimatiellales bacterium]
MNGIVQEDRLQHLKRFYLIMEELARRTQGPQILSECSGRMEWPRRGVYFFSEEGEKRTETGTGLRVVRIGTHALKAGSNTTIWNRLSQHKGPEKTGGGNHRGSIFRLLVGTALIERDGLEFPDWAKGSSAPKEIRQQEEPLERLVSQHIRSMPFLCLKVDDDAGSESLRGYIERNSIALLSNYNRESTDAPSGGWLGYSCDRKRVRDSSLWNQRHVDEGYDPAFLDVFERLVAEMGESEKWLPIIEQRDKPRDIHDGLSNRDVVDGTFCIKEHIPVHTLERSRHSSPGAIPGVLSDGSRKIKVVIQCAATKQPDAGCMIDQNGKRVMFVAQPERAPANDEIIYARPDDMVNGNGNWRQFLEEYNAQQANPLNLYPAWQLYKHKAYKSLVDRFGIENVYILSAGWGLVRGDFLTPEYDITFSPSAESYKKRKASDRYDDFSMLPKECCEDLYFFGSKNYLPLFDLLTKDYAGEKFVFYNSSVPPEEMTGCELIKYETRTKTNWHYECAKWFIESERSYSDSATVRQRPASAPKPCPTSAPTQKGRPVHNLSGNQEKATNPIGKDTKTIGINMKQEMATELECRARVMGLSTGAYCKIVFQQWLDSGGKLQLKETSETATGEPVKLESRMVEKVKSYDARENSRIREDHVPWWMFWKR